MNRRNFLASIVAAPWVVRSGVLMPVRQIVTQPTIAGGEWFIRADGSAEFSSVAVRIWSAYLVKQIEPCIIGGMQLSDRGVAMLPSRKAPALAFNRIRIGALTFQHSSSPPRRKQKPDTSALCV